MTINTEMQLINTPVKTFIAEDGTPFTNEAECKDYEDKILQETLLNEVKKLMVNDCYSPCNGGENYESHWFTWYKVENQEHVDLLNRLFEFEGTDIKVKTFPEIVCVEQLQEDCFKDCWLPDTLSGCIKYVKEFFEKGFGYDVTITKKT